VHLLVLSRAVAAQVLGLRAFSAHAGIVVLVHAYGWLQVLGKGLPVAALLSRSDKRMECAGVHGCKCLVHVRLAHAQCASAQLCLRKLLWWILCDSGNYVRCVVRAVIDSAIACIVP
jgi:hypothetical protein